MLVETIKRATRMFKLRNRRIQQRAWSATIPLLGMVGCVLGPVEIGIGLITTPDGNDEALGVVIGPTADSVEFEWPDGIDCLTCENREEPYSPPDDWPNDGCSLLKVCDFEISLTSTKPFEMNVTHDSGTLWLINPVSGSLVVHDGIEWSWANGKIQASNPDEFLALLNSYTSNGFFAHFEVRLSRSLTASPGDVVVDTATVIVNNEPIVSDSSSFVFPISKVPTCCQIMQ